MRAIREAGLQILEREGPEALTAAHIAERAGVSVGSLYQYFSSKEGVVSAVYAWKAELDFARGPGFAEEIHELPLRELLRRIFAGRIAAHRHLLELHPEFYRRHHREFSLGTRHHEDTGTEEPAAIAWMRGLLEAHADELRGVRIDIAAFLVVRGLGDVLRSAIDARPDLLFEDAFVDEVVDLACAYLLRDGGGGRS